MRRKLLSIVCMAVLLVTSLPATALGEETSNFIGVASPGSVYDEYAFKYIISDGEEALSRVSGISYDEESNTLTLNNYNGRPLAVEGLEELTIRLKGTNTITACNNAPREALIEARDSSLSFVGGGTLNLVGKKVHEKGEDYSCDYYPYGIDCQGLYAKNATIKIKSCAVGVDVLNSVKLDSNAVIDIASSTSCAMFAGRIDDRLCSISGGNSVQTILWGFPETVDILGKKGAGFTGSNDLKANKYVAKTVTISGPDGVGGEFGDGFTWHLSNKGVLTIGGTGTFSSGTGSAPWEDERSAIRSIIFKEGITGFDSDYLEGTEPSSITIPASFTEFDPYRMSEIRTQAYTVSSGNTSLTSVSGVVLSKDKKTLAAYPSGKASKSYSVPAGVSRIGEAAFRNAEVTTLTLPKALKEIDEYAFYGCRTATIKLTKGNTAFKLSNGMLLGEGGTVIEFAGSSASKKLISLPGTVKRIADYGLGNLTTAVKIIYIPESLTALGDAPWGWTTSADLFFYGDAPSVPSDFKKYKVNYIAEPDKDGWDRGVFRDIAELWEDVDTYYPLAMKLKQKGHAADEKIVAEVGNEVILEVTGEPEEAHISNLEVSTGSKNASVYIGSKYTEDELPCIYSDTAGTYTVKVTAPNGTEATRTVSFVPYFEEKVVSGYFVGSTFTRKIVGASSGLSWSSSNTSIATVDKKGKVTCRNDGVCDIIAKYNGSAYSYELHVYRELPGKQTAYIYDYNAKSKILYVSLSNDGDHSITFQSTGNRLLDPDKEGATLRNLKFKKITLKPGASAEVKFTISGSALSQSFDYEKDACIEGYMEINGRKHLVRLAYDIGYFYDEKSGQWIDLGCDLE